MSVPWFITLFSRFNELVIGHIGVYGTHDSPGRPTCSGGTKNTYSENLLRIRFFFRADIADMFLIIELVREETSDQ